MDESPSLSQKIRGKSRAFVRFVVLMARFILHPGDFLRLYQREATTADSVLDVAVLSIEQEFQERISALEARVAELEGRGTTVSRPAE
jgi:hypothetical protein